MVKDCIRYLRHPVLHAKVPLLYHCHRIAWMIYLSRAAYIYIWLISTNRFNVYIYVQIIIYIFWKQVYIRSMQYKEIASFALDHPIGSLKGFFLEIQEPGRRDAEKEGGRAKFRGKLWVVILQCGEGGKVTPTVTMVLQSIFNDSEMDNTWIWLKASGGFKPNSHLLRLFIIRHLLGRLTLIKLEWFQISVRVPATCGSFTSFTCTNWKHIFNDVSQTLVLFGAFKIKINHGKFID